MRLGVMRNVSPGPGPCAAAPRGRVAVALPALPHMALSDEAGAAAPFGKPTAEDVGGLLWASVTAGCKNSWQEVCSPVWSILNVLLIQPTSEFCRIIQYMQNSYVTSYF